MLCGGIDEVKAVRTGWKDKVFGGGVKGGVVGEWRKEVGEGGMILVQKCDCPCV